jgi:hypothetical protein
VSDASTGVAGHVFNTPCHATAEALIPPFSHFDPFGTEFCEPGRVSHPDPNRLLQRSFQLSPELLTSTRESGFHRSNTYIQRDCDLFVSKAFNVSHHDRFTINALQGTQRLSQSSFALVCEGVSLGVTVNVRL